MRHIGSAAAAMLVILTLAGCAGIGKPFDSQGTVSIKELASGRRGPS